MSRGITIVCGLARLVRLHANYMRLPATDNHCACTTSTVTHLLVILPLVNVDVSFLKKTNSFRIGCYISSVQLQLKMKWLSVLALCAALFIAATHACQPSPRGRGNDGSCC